MFFYRLDSSVFFIIQQVPILIRFDFVQNVVNYRELRNMLSHDFSSSFPPSRAHQQAPLQLTTEGELSDRASR